MLDLRGCERSILCQFRTGVLPLHIETGRYTGLPADQRLCSLCTTTEPDIEDETHFLLNCELYNDLRQHTFSDLFREIPQGTDNEELTYVVTHHPRKFAKFLLSAY